jgi:hypothetical protein
VVAVPFKLNMTRGAHGRAMLVWTSLQASECGATTDAPVTSVFRFC